MILAGPPVDPGMLTIDGGGAVLIAAGIQAAATVLAVIVAGLVAGSYAKQRRESRARDRAQIHADALKAIHDYLEAPYRIRRRDGSAEARMSLTNLVSDIQARLRYFETLLRLESSAQIADAYEAATSAARREAGLAVTAAWRSAPTRRDSEVPIGERIETPTADKLIAEVRELMRRDVQVGRRGRARR